MNEVPLKRFKNIKVSIVRQQIALKHGGIILRSHHSAPGVKLSQKLIQIYENTGKQ